jgi:hypothetical protein
MKSFLIGMALSFISTSSIAQFDTAEIKKNIYANIDSMLVLFAERDWDKYADFMHPNVITIVGGREAFAGVLKSQMKMLDSAVFEEISKGQILQVVKKGNQYQCIAESFMQMQVMGMVVSGSSYDVGISEDGVKWNFTRIPEGGYVTIKQIIPDINPLLKLPKSKMEPGITLEEFKKDYTITYFKEPVQSEPAPKSKPKAVYKSKSN